MARNDIELSDLSRCRNAAEGPAMGIAGFQLMMPARQRGLRRKKR